MARENQGLQVALIIFVMLTIILGVTTFLFFRQYEDALLAAKDAQDKQKTSDTAANTLLTEATRLKAITGFATTDSISAIDEAYNADMEKYAGTFEEANRNYRKVLEYLNDEVERKSVSLATEQDTLQQMKTRNEGIETQKQAQIDQYKTASDKSAADLAAERGKFNSQLQAANKQSGDLQAKLDDARKERDAVVAQVQDRLQNALDKMQKMNQTLVQRNEQINQILRPTFEAGDGNIRWVNQRNATVWINLGQADSLRRQMTFSIYPADTKDVNRAGKKGEIEVTELLGDHLSEARIVSDEVSDPILPGDIVHTPVWAPGERLHFALTDRLDIDGDGKSDTELVRNLITMNDGLIDAELDDQGNRTGAMTTSTRFLVLGTQHDEDTPDKPRDERVRMLREAEDLGIGTMALPDLLRQMGWKNQTPVIRFGRGANPDDFRAQPPEGVPRVSSGTVSPLFERRNPPRSAGSMY
jgi:hypothetical protein